VLVALWSYLREQVWPRRRELATGSQPWLAVAIAVAFAAWGSHGGLGESKLRDVVPAVLAYGAIGFGFALAGLTIAITIPDAGFTKRLATQTPPPDDPQLSAVRRRRRNRMRQRNANAYSDLLFVFSWTAFVHWLTLIGSIAMVACYGLDHQFVPKGSCVSRTVAGGLIGLLAYSVMQFLVTVLTLSGLGGAYISALRNRAE
jgi:hypothetical protein